MKNNLWRLGIVNGVQNYLFVNLNLSQQDKYKAIKRIVIKRIFPKNTLQNKIMKEILNVMWFYKN